MTLRATDWVEYLVTVLPPLPPSPPPVPEPEPVPEARPVEPVAPQASPTMVRRLLAALGRLLGL